VRAKTRSWKCQQMNIIMLSERAPVEGSRKSNIIINTCTLPYSGQILGNAYHPRSTTTTTARLDHPQTVSIFVAVPCSFILPFCSSLSSVSNRGPDALLNIALCRLKKSGIYCQSLPLYWHLTHVKTLGREPGFSCQIFPNILGCRRDLVICNCIADPGLSL
jgi:hypothetical protein